MTEEIKAEIALAKARDFRDGDPKPFRAQMEWEEHLMKEQQRLNRRTVLFSVIISSILGMLGIMGGVFLENYLESNRKAHYQQTRQDTAITLGAKKPQTKTRETSTMNKTSSSQPPIKEKHE